MDKKSHTMGAGGYCICVKCGYKKPHKSGVPCRDEKCPECGVRLLREGSEHHKKFLEKRKDGSK